MTTSSIKDLIDSGKAVMGIELGSTRIKAVLIDENHVPVASGSFDWESHLENGVWTYSLAEIHEGLQKAYAALAEDVRQKYHTQIRTLAAIGISAMMHGYLVFDENDALLVPFRTWRNTMTKSAADALTEMFGFPIPERFSIAHLYSAILKGEEHVTRIHTMTTLAGYLHWQLTGEKAVGVGEASGMFPIDSSTCDYDEEMMQKFDSCLAERGLPYRLRDILPRVLTAGENAGILTAAGTALLDPSGTLLPGIPFCPPEGDAGTGMAATNSISPRTGNVSAGTSVFAMVVLEKPLASIHREIDLVTTPAGDPVAMVHCNNCTADINAFASLFAQFSELTGNPVDTDTLYTKLFETALAGDKDCGGLLSYNYVAGETITGFSEGRPLLVRTPDARFSLSNLMRMNLYSALAPLKIGLDILLKEEHVTLDVLTGHGGFFKTPEVGQKILAAAVDTPVFVMQTAGEGGPWGMALLASYMVHKKEGESLSQFLTESVFSGEKGTVVSPDPEDVAGFDAYFYKYKKGLPIEEAAVTHLHSD